MYHKARIFFCLLLPVTVFVFILYSSCFQTMDRDPFVGRGRNFSGSRKSFKILITACFVSNTLKEINILNRYLLSLYFFPSTSKYMQNYVGPENLCFEKWVVTYKA